MESNRLRWVHRLSDVNSETKRATCAACGDVEVVLKDKGYGKSGWRCKVKESELEARRRRTVTYKDYQREYQREWRAGRQAYVAHVNLKAALKRYGISEEEYRKRLEEQAGHCAICGDLVGKLVIDHNHKTDQFRGLVCYWCNWMLGAARDRPQALRAGATYLETTP